MLGKLLSEVLLGIGNASQQGKRNAELAPAMRTLGDGGSCCHPLQNPEIACFHSGDKECEKQTLEDVREALVYQPGDGYAYIVVDVTAAAGNPSRCDRRQGGSPNREQEEIGVGQRNLKTLKQEANHECAREPQKNVAYAAAATISSDFPSGPAGQYHKW